MPRLNSSGGVAMGIAGIQGSINGELIPNSYGPQWYDLNNAVFQQPSDGAIILYDINTKVRSQQIVRPANDVMAGGNVWALWANGFGLQTSTGWFDPIAGLLNVGPDGAVGYVVDRQQGFGANVREVNGITWTLTDDVVYDLQLLGSQRAIWRDQFFKIKTRNIPSCIQIGNAFRPRTIEFNGVWWVCYYSDVLGVVLHPFNSTIGYHIVPLGVDAFQHDAININGIVTIAWSVRAGELPEDLRVKNVNLLTDVPVDLLPVVEVPPTNKDCWLGWFEFVNEPNPIGPANCLLFVKDGGKIKSNGTQFAQWVQGDSVESIESQADASSYPCVVYWDSRYWPRLPNIDDQDYLGIQAYCKVSETPDQFELAMRQYIDDVFLLYNKVALICQCYTSNNSLTSNISGLVPVYARLARDYPNILMLLVFSDQGRATGLNDHPEVRPYWEKLMEGITGTPTEEDNLLPLDVFETLQTLRPKYPTPMGNHAAELLNEVAYIHRDGGWGLHAKPGGANCAQPQTNTACSCDILRTHSTWYDVLQDAEGDATPVRTEGEPTASPNDWVAPVPVAQPSNINVLILDYDKVVRRSDPNGMLIRFECESANPIVEVDLELLNDNEPSILIKFLNEPRRDGRYCRALAFKPTVNGDWILRVSAKDNQGNVGHTDGPVPVHVEP